MEFQGGSAELAEPGALVVHSAASWLKWSSGGTASEMGAASLAEPGAEAAAPAATANDARPNSRNFASELFNAALLYWWRP